MELAVYHLGLKTKAQINMIPVKTYPKFKCEFCKKKAVEHAMKRHEKICYYNPNRVCDRCDGEGNQDFWNGNPDGSGVFLDSRPCEACKLFNEINEKRKTQQNF